MKINIVALTETKKKRSGAPKDQRTAEVVSLLLHKKHQQNLHNWYTINDRIVVANQNKYRNYLFRTLPTKVRDLTKRTNSITNLRTHFSEIREKSSFRAILSQSET